MRKGTENPIQVKHSIEASTLELEVLRSGEGRLVVSRTPSDKCYNATGVPPSLFRDIVLAGSPYSYYSVLSYYTIYTIYIIYYLYPVQHLSLICIVGTHIKLILQYITSYVCGKSQFNNLTEEDSQFAVAAVKYDSP